MLRLLALVAAALCVGGAWQLSELGSEAPADGGAVAEPAPDAVGFADILGRVDAPAQVVPVADFAGVAPGDEPDAVVAADPFTPVRVEVPSAAIRAPVDPKGLDRHGELEVPDDGSRAGWWSGGARAGEQGPTVIVGHVDFRGGHAGIFHSLHLLAPGDRVRVVAEDGRYLEYEITGVETFAKTDFPTDEIYGPTPGAELRLITCGGPFSLVRRSYRDNVIAYASLVAPAG